MRHRGNLAGISDDLSPVYQGIQNFVLPCEQFSEHVNLQSFGEFS